MLVLGGVQIKIITLVDIVNISVNFIILLIISHSSHVVGTKKFIVIKTPKKEVSKTKSS